MSPPRHLGNFEVGAELGRGPAGVVDHARERLTGRAVALKVVSRELARPRPRDGARPPPAAGGDAPQRLALMDGGRTLLVGTARGIVLRFAVLWE